MKMRQSFRKRARRGYTLLEVQVALLLLGIGLAGVGPLVVMQLRLARKIDQGYNPLTSNFHGAAPTGIPTPFYLAPASSSWARKLGAAATVTATTPVPVGPDPLASYAVSIVAPAATNAASDTVSLTVSVTQ